MAKGGILIGCGFKPTQADVENAIEAGHIKNCDAVSTTSFDLEVDEKLAYVTYISMLREKGWENLGGLQAMRLTTRDAGARCGVYIQLVGHIRRVFINKWPVRSGDSFGNN